jgi:hypothetical protein
VTDPAEEVFLSKDVRSKIRKIWQRRLVWGNIIASHLVGALLIMGGMEILERALEVLHLEKVFDGTPFEFQLRWVVNSSDLALLVGFLARGVYEVWRAEDEK